MVLIIGAGLTGLLTAYRLKQNGVPFKILEARDRIGGRINTILGKNEIPVEMGATWFQDHHQNLIALLNELGLDAFEQYMDKTVLFQQQAHSPVQLMEIGTQTPSYRIAGGTLNLINTLYQNLESSDVFLNQQVKKIVFLEQSVQVIAKETFEASNIVLAIPPRLWAKNISFEPNLPADLLNVGRETHTWMEDSIKVALIFNQPFWQEQNIPATFFSNAGPITEFYDHCNVERTKFALCGFMNSSFKNKEERQNIVINQLKTAFGEIIESFLEYDECIWSNEQFTFESSDNSVYPHQNNGNPIFRETFFNDRLFISSSESATSFPGYMEGAVISGNLTAEKLIKSFK